jgi:hypothetical protein
MTLRYPLLAFALVVGSACDDTRPVCGDGYTLSADETECLPLDAGPDTGAPDSSTDAAPDSADDADTAVDAGPCGMPCEGATPICDEVGERCVACLMDSDCTELDAPQCDTTAGTCGACSDDDACIDRTGTETCALTGASMGSCVECIDNSGCEATEGCDLPTNACRTFTAESANTCGDCVADAECMAGRLCIPFTYDDPRTPAADPVPAGNHCAFRQDAAGPGAPAGDCVNIRPYVRAQMAMSVDGVETTFCTFRQSTCEAHRDFSMTDCMTLDLAGDALCGIDDVGDGVCRMFGATTNRCTVFCGSDDDCPMGFACDTAATPRVCLF